MPYIPQENRPAYEEAIEKIVDQLVQLDNENDVEGHFNYVVSSIIHRYMKKTGPRYYKINKFIGALHCISDEFYRTSASPYEDCARENNGDI
jgi:hypothetical protein